MRTIIKQSKAKKKKPKKNHPNKTEKPTHKYKKYGETAKGERGEKYLAFPAAISLSSYLPSFPLPSEVRDSIPCTSQRWNLLIRVCNYIQLRFIFLWALTEAMKIDLPHVENEIFKLNISLIISSIFLTCLHFWNGKHLIFAVNLAVCNKPV